MILLCDLISHHLKIFHQIHIYLPFYFYQILDLLNLIVPLQNIVLMRNRPAHITSYHFITILISIY